MQAAPARAAVQHLHALMIVVSHLSLHHRIFAHDGPIPPEMLTSIAAKRILVMVVNGTKLGPGSPARHPLNRRRRLPREPGVHLHEGFRRQRAVEGRLACDGAILPFRTFCHFLETSVYMRDDSDRRSGEEK